LIHIMLSLFFFTFDFHKKPIMKKIYLLLLSISSFTGINAQYVLTNTHIPMISDIEIQVIDTLPSSSITPGGIGANQFWDLSDLNNHFEQAFNYVDPSTTAYGSEFPSASVARDAGSFIGYLDVTGGLKKIVGIAIDFEFEGTQVQGYSEVTPYDTLLIVGSSYEDEYSDFSSYSVSAYYGGEIQGFQVDSIRQSEQKTEEVVFDAYGSLTTPNGIFNNVLREKVITTTTTLQEGYIMFLGWTPSPEGETIQETIVYNWHASGVKAILASITTDLSGNVLAASYNNSSDATAIYDLSASSNEFTLYPNPTINQIIVTGTNKQQTALVYDITGKLVLSTTLNKDISTINVQELNTGTYHVQVLENNTLVSTIPFVKN
jgi:hypothetical protein